MRGNSEMAPIGLVDDVGKLPGNGLIHPFSARVDAMFKANQSQQIG